MLEDGFADIIGKARFGKGVSLSELARRSLISETRITALENEVKPSQGEITSLGSLLGLDVKKLRGISEHSWKPTLSPPYILDTDKKASVDMIHVIDGKIGNYPVNGYIFIDWKRGECVLFDTGYSADKVITFLKENSIRLLAICLTHAHPDHIGGVQEIQGYTNVPVYLHIDEMIGKIDLKSRIYIEEKMTIKVGRFTAMARLTPGHTDGGVSYFMDLQTEIPRTIAFVGDALFAGSIGKAKSSETYKTLLDSVQNVILSYPPSTLLFPGHGPVTSVEEEHKYNPFFR